jgi:hypothetical protein
MLNIHFWNSVVYNPSGAKLLDLLHRDEFEISAAPQCPTYYSFAGNGDVLDTVHKNVRLSEVIGLTFWTQISYQSLSTYWIIAELGVFRTRLTNSQIGSGFKAWALK